MIEVASKPITVIRYAGSEAVRKLSAPLRSAGLLPAPVIEMEPEFLADGFEGKEPGALVAYRDEIPVAYLPYILRRINFRVLFGPSRLGRFPCRQLVLYGYVSNENNHTPILNMFFDSLFKQQMPWHVAQIFDMAVKTPLSEHVNRMLLSDAGIRPASKVFDTLQVDLDETFEDYLATRFNKKIRYNLKREVRLLEAADPGQVVTKVYTSPDEVAEFLRNAERIAKRTYQWKLGFSTIDVTPSFVKREECLARHEKLRSYILFIREVPAAYCLGSIRWGEFSYDIVGYDPQFAKLNPGKVLLYNILEDLHQNSSIDRVNFGKGITDYKKLFSTSSRQTLDASFYAPGFYPQFLRLLSNLADTGYRRLHPLIKPWMPYIKHKYQKVTALAASFSGLELLEFYLSLGSFN